MCAVPQEGGCTPLDLSFSWLMGHLKAGILSFLSVCSAYQGKVGRPTSPPWTRAVGTWFQEIYILSGSVRVVDLNIKVFARSKYCD